MALVITTAEDEVNEVDGTTAEWEFQPGLAHVYLINKTTGAKYMIQLHQLKEPTSEED